MTPDETATLSLMGRFAGPAPSEVVERVRATSPIELAIALDRLQLAKSDVIELAGHWDDFRAEPTWVHLLASLVSTVERQRGDVDAPIPVWSDLDEAGVSGRLFYFYLFALCAEGLEGLLSSEGFPAPIIERTMGLLARKLAIHQRKWGTLGVDAGWWTMLALRGELIHVGSLQFHRETLGVGSLSPHPWYSENDVASRGVGFRRGDSSLGIHIPDGTDLSPVRLDATFDEARHVLGRSWPATQRRLATCQSWMLDDQLAKYLGDGSNILGFQGRFTMLPAWIENNEDALEFVFRSPQTRFEQLPRATSLQRAIIDIVERAGHSRIRTGWIDFDGR